MLLGEGDPSGYQYLNVYNYNVYKICINVF